MKQNPTVLPYATQTAISFNLLDKFQEQPALNFDTPTALGIQTEKEWKGKAKISIRKHMPEHKATKYCSLPANPGL